MSPALKGDAIARAVGPSAQRTVASDDELVVGCPLVNPCGWESVRPLRAVHSAQVAHRMRHAKGMVP